LGFNASFYISVRQLDLLETFDWILGVVAPSLLLEASEKRIVVVVDEDLEGTYRT
jgi:hypothetical protein